MSVMQQTGAAIVEGLAKNGIDVRRLGVYSVKTDEDLALLWRKAISFAGRRTLPFEVGLMMPIGAMGSIDYLTASSATVGAALSLTQMLFPLVGPGVQLNIERLRAGRRRISVVNQPPFPGQLESDSFIIGILLGRLRYFTSRPLGVPVVELTEPEPELPQRWLDLVMTGDLHFGARRAAIHLSSKDWEAPLRSTDPRLLATLSSIIGLNHRGENALLVTIRALAAQRLPSCLALSEAASALGYSRRSLQRKLAESSTSLSQLVDEARRDKAEQLSGQGELSFGEISVRVGFAERASFTRAWQRWFGVTPTRSALR
jgi:AraC-like DNA-binding protein